MADAGASEMIILVASLLVAGIASVVLIDAWDGVATANGDVVNARAANMETEISFGGDPANVPYDDNSDKITLFLVNTGQRNLDRTTLGLFVNGDAYGGGSQLDTSGVALAAGYVWGPGDMIMIELDDQDGKTDSNAYHVLRINPYSFLLCFQTNEDSTLSLSGYCNQNKHIKKSLLSIRVKCVV